MSEPLSAAEAERLREAVREKYRRVAREPRGHFGYPVGRESALGLGYEEAWLDAIPEPVVEGFVGVGNPFRVRRPRRGERVLDLGCGSGLDAFVAALLVGARGGAVGVDLVPEMLEVAARGASGWEGGNVEFVPADVERLPFEDESFDVVLSNGVLNLVPDKDAAFREARRVLRPSGAFVAADLLVMASIPAEVLASVDAWST